MKINRMMQVLMPLLFIAFLISISWTYISFRTESKSSTVNQVRVSIRPDYRIISGEDLMLWPKGTELEQGLAAYFYAAKPEITITPTVQVTGLNQGVISGTIQSTVTLQAINDKSQVYWSYVKNQTPTLEFTLTAGESSIGQATYTSDDILLDASQAYQFMTDIGNELMFQSGLYQIMVTTSVKINSLIGGITVEKDYIQTLPITLQQVSFLIPGTQEAALQDTLSGNAVQLSVQEKIIEAVRINFIPLLIDALLLLLLILVYSDTKLTKSKASKEHRRFKEWITEGSVEVQDRTHIHILTLEGLVDLAIDLDKRVIFDPGIHKYFVLTEDIAYLYDSERSQALLENREQLGKLLIKRGLIQPEQLEIGLYYQKQLGIKLGKSLIALGFIDETTLYSTLAAQQGLDYYELSPEKDYINTEILKETGLQKARAFMAVPLGERPDGKLIVACSETARKDLRKSLQELFKRQVCVVATRPSVIFDILKSFENKGKEAVSPVTLEESRSFYERLTKEEAEQFILDYHRGRVVQTLLIKASGLIRSEVLMNIPEQEKPLPWLVSKNFLTGETANLVLGLGKAVEAMDFKLRQEKQLPGLLELLFHSNYLTSVTMEWISRELILQGLPIEQFLRNNYLAAESTIQSAILLLNTLEGILYKIK